jgi:YD repeat-containing protein
VDQLTAATKMSTDPTPVTLKRYAYAYDSAGNRTAEQVDDAVMAGSHNERNQLETLQPGGALRFQGTLDEEARVTVGGEAAEVRPDNTFEGRAEVGEGTSQVDVEAQDYSGNVRTNTYEVSQTGATTSYTYDANGSLTDDGTRTYEWDGANRLVSVSEGPTELASFVYDGQGRRIQKVSGGVTGPTSTTARTSWRSASARGRPTTTSTAPESTSRWRGSTAARAAWSPTTWRTTLGASSGRRMRRGSCP